MPLKTPFSSNETQNLTKVTLFWRHPVDIHLLEAGQTSFKLPILDRHNILYLFLLLRSPEGKLQPDPKRFPSGIPALAEYIHKLGLKFGIYEDYGNLTCGGYPGILGHMETDAKTFAEWGVDYVKLDGCYSEPSTMDAGYPQFGLYLNQTNRPMVYSCSWPAYQIGDQCFC